MVEDLCTAGPEVRQWKYNHRETGPQKRKTGNQHKPPPQKIKKSKSKKKSKTMTDTEIAERNKQDIISYFPLKGPLTLL